MIQTEFGERLASNRNLRLLQKLDWDELVTPKLFILLESESESDILLLLELI